MNLHQVAKEVGAVCSNYEANSERICIGSDLHEFDFNPFDLKQKTKKQKTLDSSVMPLI